MDGNKNIHNYIVIVSFIIMIFLPQILFWFLKEYIAVDTSENRILSEKPKFEFATLQEYPVNFDKFYNDNLPFRGIIRNTWTNINFLLFKDTTSDKVLVGKNEGDISSTWLFYKDDKDGNPVKEAQGLICFTEEEKNNILNSIVENTKKLKEKNIDLYYAIIPNKENIYSDKLPANIKIYDNNSRTDKLVTILQNEKKIKNLIYPKSELMQARNNNQIYYKQDTHWNSYGAYIGFSTIMNIIDSENYERNMKVTRLNEEYMYCDLTKFSGIKNIFKDTEMDVTYLPDTTYTMEQIKTKTNLIQITTCEQAQIDKTLFVVGDSFREKMIPYFSKTYRKVIYMHRNDYSADILNQYSPDIIICQFVERYFPNIKDFKLY